MSRCFPYPPPGYERNGIRDEALIQSIKLQREGEKKAKKEREKEKRREKKEEEKEKAWKDGEIESKKQSHKKRHRDERRREEQNGGDRQKSGQNEVEQLEKSSLTEEHGYPVGSQNSSDSTLNSSKRQKQSLTLDDRHNSGSIIRIRLPFQRHKDPEMLPSKEQPCSALGGTDDASVKGIHESSSVSLDSEQEEQPCSTSKSKDQEPSPRLGKEKSSTPGACQIFSRQTNSAPPSNLCGSCSPSLAVKFRDLVEDWVPSRIQNEYTGLGNQEWLLEAKQKQNQKQDCEAKLHDVGSIGLGCANSAAWPRSCYLPEVDIYALPFTVPF